MHTWWGEGSPRQQDLVGNLQRPYRLLFALARGQGSRVLHTGWQWSVGPMRDHIAICHRPAWHGVSK